MTNRLWVTEEQLQHQSPDELRQLIARYQRIINGSGYGFWEWDLRTNRIDWIGDFWQQLGYGKEESSKINQSSQLPDYFHPDDVASATAALKEHLHTGKPFDINFRIKAKDGSYCWTQSQAKSIRDNHGRVTHISGVNFDITRLKQTEDALRATEARHARIIDASDDGIWEWSADSGGFHFSSRCWEHLGYTDDDDVVMEGRNRLTEWRSWMHPEDLPRFDQMLKDHLGGRGPFDIEYRIYNKQNEICWIRARGSATFNEEGSATSMSGTNMDVTELKRAQERVMQAKEAAERANLAKSEFLSSMSHELRTPLNAILGFSQLFDYDDNINADQRENVREIRKAGQHLLQLINDVLDLSKIESGKMTLSLEPVLPSRIVDECFTMVQSLADGKGIDLRINWQDLSDRYIYADRVRLKQALLNLINNAVKYNHLGGRVEVIFSEAENDHLRIAVVDSGNGIAEELQSEVFQPFNRLGAEGSKVEGSGVGLVITRRFVEMMAGSIGFSSKAGEGSTFWLELPLAEEWGASLPSTGAFMDGTPLQLQLKQPRHVLYIEDNPSNIRVMQQFFLRFPQLTLDTADEAFLGLYKARTEQPDIIILDINLPGMDGYEALDVLQQDPATCSIPVLALSANAMPQDVSRGLEAGFLEYLTKPLEINSLIAALNRLSGFGEESGEEWGERESGNGLEEARD